ncbi:hypothetical protein LTR28_002313, partial [Elasticomyces elasticus]
LTLRTPCRPSRNLLNCPDFTSRQPGGPAAFPKKPGYWAPEGVCPWCDLKGEYDMRFVRVVRMRWMGIRIGLGPGRRDPGVDVVCCCVM